MYVFPGAHLQESLGYIPKTRIAASQHLRILLFLEHVKFLSQAVLSMCIFTRSAIKVFWFLHTIINQYFTLKFLLIRLI